MSQVCIENEYTPPDEQDGFYRTLDTINYKMLQMKKFRRIHRSKFITILSLFQKCSLFHNWEHKVSLPSILFSLLHLTSNNRWTEHNFVAFFQYEKNNRILIQDLMNCNTVVHINFLFLFLQSVSCIFHNFILLIVMNSDTKLKVSFYRLKNN